MQPASALPDGSSRFYPQKVTTGCKTPKLLRHQFSFVPHLAIQKGRGGQPLSGTESLSKSETPLQDPQIPQGRYIDKRIIPIDICVAGSVGRNWGTGRNCRESDRLSARLPEVFDGAARYADYGTHEHGSAVKGAK